MTLVHSFASGQFALQVSDRRLTLADGRTWDAAANKTIIYESTNAIVSISYTGTAYLRDPHQPGRSIPTDHWIAQSLWGKPVGERVPGRPVAMTQGTPGQRLDIRAALELLRQRLERSVRGDSIPEPPTIAVVGWHGSDFAWRPIYYSIDPRPSRTSGVTYHIVAAPKDWHLDPRGLSRVWRVPLANTTTADDSWLRQEFAAAAQGGAIDIEAVESNLIKATRRVADRNSLVGKDCMSVLITHPQDAYIVARYDAYDDRPAIVETGAPNAYALPAAYSPWVVGPGHLYAPSVIAGERLSIVGRFTVLLKTPALGDNAGTKILSFMSSRERKRYS